MSTDHHLLNLQMRNSIFDHTRRTQIVRMYRVRNVSVHEDVARLAVADGCFGYATVGTAYPQDFGRLAFCEVAESVRICFSAAPVVVPASGDQVIERI